DPRLALEQPSFLRVLGAGGQELLECEPFPARILDHLHHRGCGPEVDRSDEAKTADPVVAGLVGLGRHRGPSRSGFPRPVAWENRTNSSTRNASRGAPPKFTKSMAYRQLGPRRLATRGGTGSSRGRAVTDTQLSRRRAPAATRGTPKAVVR